MDLTDLNEKLKLVKEELDLAKSRIKAFENGTLQIPGIVTDQDKKEVYLKLLEKENKLLDQQNKLLDKENLLDKTKKFLVLKQVRQKKGDELVSKHEAELKLWTRQYFSNEAGLSVSHIEFQEKKEGDQLGKVALIRHKNAENVYETIKFYIKTHEGAISLSIFDPREMLVYKFLELIGVGAEVHFYFSAVSRSNLYIASKQIESFKSFNERSNDLDFVNKFGRNLIYMKCLIYMELICKMFYLNDVSNNLTNFGLVEPVSSYKNIRIIDFFISSEFLKENMLELFESPDISLSGKRYLDNATHNYLFTLKKEDKISMARYIISDIIQSDENFFYRNLNNAIKETNLFFDKYQVGLPNHYEIKFKENKNSYTEYIEKVNLNFQKFIKEYTKSDV